jgi:hypothetical protein
LASQRRKGALKECKDFSPLALNALSVEAKYISYFF